MPSSENGVGVCCSAVFFRLRYDSFHLGAANPVMAFQIGFSLSHDVIVLVSSLWHLHPLSVLSAVLCQPVLHCSVLSLPVVLESQSLLTIKNLTLKLIN